MYTTPASSAVRRLLGVLPLALLVFSVACDGAAPNTIGGYCRRDTDCVSGLRCLNLTCSERRSPDAGGPADLGQGSTDLGAQEDGGANDMGSGPLDTGVDSGPLDMGVDSGPLDMGVDSGPLDMGVDSGPTDMGVDSGP